MDPALLFCKTQAFSLAMPMCGSSPPDFYERLKVGVIAEESIHERDILSPTDTVTGLWYLGSMIVSPALRQEQPTKAAKVFTSLCGALPTVFKNTDRCQRFCLR